MHLADNKEIGIVIADKPGGGHKEDSRWLAETLRLTNDGTEHVAPDRIVMPIVTAASNHVPHLQLADLIVAATTAALAGHDAGLALGPTLLQPADKNSWDLAGGAGIVVWPTNGPRQSAALGVRRRYVCQGREERGRHSALPGLALRQ